MTSPLKPFEGYQETTLGVIARKDGYGLVDGPFGSALPASEYTPDGIPVIRGSNLSLGVERFRAGNYVFVSEATAERLRRSICEPTDIIFTKKGTLGQTGIVPSTKAHKRFLLSSNQMKLSVDSSVADPLFVYYYVSSPQSREKIVRESGITGVPKTNLEYLRKFPITLPSLITQRKIASVLSAYDDLTENNARRIEILEEMAQRIYREWFVYFRFPGHEKVGMVESELGPIPEGWDVVKLAEVCDLVMGQSPKSEYYNVEGKGLPFHQGVKDFGSRFPTNRLYCTVENRIAEAGDILFSVRAPVGRINLTTYKIVIGRGLSAIRSKSGYQAFVFQQLKEEFQEEDSIGGGTIFKAVTKSDMQNIKVLQPEDLLIQRFESLIRPMFKEIENLSSKNVNLRHTRDLLLPKLISGEASVEGLDIDLEKVSNAEFAK